MSVAKAAYTDILLARGRTKVDVSNFKKDLNAALLERGIPESNIRYIEGDTSVAEGASGFNQFSWTFNNSRGYSNSSSSTIPGQCYLAKFAFSGKDLVLTGNRDTGGNCILSSTIPETKYLYSIDFDYNSDFGDNFYGTGVFVQTTLGMSNGGILVWLAKGGNSNGKSSGVYQATINANGTFSIGTRYNVSIPVSGHLSLKINNGEITVNNTVLPGDYEGTRWGFITDQYDHNCDQIGRFDFRNLQVSMTSAKEFKKILTEEQNNWKEGYEHVLVDVIDGDTESTFNSGDANYYDVINMMNIGNIRLVGWGTDSNQTIFQNYINMLPNGGIVCNTGTYNESTHQRSGYQNAINKTADYIASFAHQQNTDDVVILDQPSVININPESAKSVKQWFIKHDDTKLNATTSLDNGEGISKYDGTANVAFPSDFKFDKPGLYKFYYGYSDFVNDIPVSTVTVHRRPIAVMNMQGRTQQSTGIYNYTFTSDSYDPDNNTDTNGLGKGIKALAWQYRSDGGPWISAGSGMAAVIPVDANHNTDIQLTVTDNFGAEAVTTRTINQSSKPVAYFSIDKDVLYPHENISITDTSYDPLDRKITSEVWNLKKGNTVIYSGSTPPSFAPKDKGMTSGTYTVDLTVTNSSGAISYTYKQTLTVNPYTVRYNTNGGNETYNTQNKEYGQNINLISSTPTHNPENRQWLLRYNVNGGKFDGPAETNLTVPGTFTFTGWNTKADGTGDTYNRGAVYSENENAYLYAQWQMDTNGIDVQLDSHTPTRTGYTFAGWYTETSGGIKAGMPGDTIHQSESDKVLYAHWTPNTYTIQFNANGGTGSMTSQKMTYDSTETLTPVSLTKKGYSFAGWNTSQNGSGTSYSDQQQIQNLTPVNNGNIMLYAQWKIKTSDLQMDVSLMDGVIKTDSPPTIILKVAGTDLDGNNITKVLAYKFNNNSKASASVMLPSGKYTVTEIAPARYKVDTIQGTANISEEDKKAIVDLTDGSGGTVTLTQKCITSAYLSGGDMAVNHV